MKRSRTPHAHTCNFFPTLLCFSSTLPRYFGKLRDMAFLSTTPTSLCPALNASCFVLFSLFCPFSQAPFTNCNRTPRARETGPGRSCVKHGYKSQPAPSILSRLLGVAFVRCTWGGWFRGVFVVVALPAEPFPSAVKCVCVLRENLSITP